MCGSHRPLAPRARYPGGWGRSSITKVSSCSRMRMARACGTWYPRFMFILFVVQKKKVLCFPWSRGAMKYVRTYLTTPAGRALRATTTAAARTIKQSYNYTRVLCQIPISRVHRGVPLRDPPASVGGRWKTEWMQGACRRTLRACKTGKRHDYYIH